MKYRRRIKYYLLKLFRLQDSSKAVAGGIAWGVFVHFYPTCGFGALLAVGLAGLFRANLIAATLGWAISMPLFPLFFYLNYLMGDLLLGQSPAMVHQSLHVATVVELRELLYVGQAFLIGSAMNGLIVVTLTWWVLYLLLKRYRTTALKFIRKKLRARAKNG